MALVNCPECSNQVSDQATACPKCGHPIKSAAAPRVQATSDTGVATPDAKTCPRCRKGVDPRAYRCPYCKKVLRTTPTTWGCLLIILFIVIVGIVANLDSCTNEPQQQVTFSMQAIDDREWLRSIGFSDKWLHRASEQLILSAASNQRAMHDGECGEAREYMERLGYNTKGVYTEGTMTDCATLIKSANQWKALGIETEEQHDSYLRSKGYR